MKIKIILLLVVCYIGSLLITLPAQQVVRFIPDNAGVTIDGASGTLWNGKITQLNYKNKFQLQALDWKINWLALFALKLQLDVEFNNGSKAMSGKGVAIYGLSGLSLENFFVDMSAAELISYLRLSVPVQINGDLSLVIKKASQGSPYCQELDGVAIWKNAIINSELGDVDLDVAQVDLSCDKGQLVADLQQNSEALTASGHFILQKNGLYQLQGLLKPGENLEPAIKDLLSWVGAKNNLGETVLKFNGKL